MKAIHALLTLAVLAGIAATLAFAGPDRATAGAGKSCCRAASCCTDKNCCDAGKCCDSEKGCQSADCKSCGSAKTTCHDPAPAAGAMKSCCRK